ncbi:MAG: transporter [Bacteroidota bacterium]
MKKNIYSSVLTLTLAVLSFQLFTSTAALAQGCVAIRQMSTYSANGSGALEANQWQFSASYRYFRSHRHFVGTEEQTIRREKGTEVVNMSNSLDLALTYSVTNRLIVGITIPLSYTDRTSLYEHLGNDTKPNPLGLRFNTNSQGLGDIRLSANYWMLNPESHKDGNISLGAGVKAPTGNYDVQGDFQKATGVVHKTVDQSLQLGDGGWGITLEMQAYKKLFNRAFAYTNAFYLINPRVMVPNGTRSTPDQFSARAGVTYTVLPTQGIALGLGGRIEGLPSQDLIGSSEGGRRPGYIISIEPSISYTKGKDFFSLNVPVALVRDRTQNYSDKLNSTPEKKVQGDAAFADFLVSISYSHRF